MTFPLAEEARTRVTQPFGVPNKAYKSGIHNGVDFGVPIGSDITAPCKGRIYRVYRDHPSMGNAIYFRSADGTLWFRFLHCSSVADVGDVEEGQWIGYTGNTGRSDGAHLHLEAWKVPISTSILYTEKSVRANLIDPLTLFT